MIRLQLQITGVVQGVGFRPFVYHLAHDLGLTGWIQNTDQGVSIELEGTAQHLQEFQARLPLEQPTHAQLQQIEVNWIEAVGDQEFVILTSNQGSSSQPKSALILPDLATCPACLADIFDPENRRYRYPFTNCTHCGPRFSIVRSLPYDRSNTTLQGFPLCPACQAEYDNPHDRRFHAQPNACPMCGPHLELWDRSGQVVANQDEALRLAAEAVRSGQIMALKGLGGFQLIVDARNNVAVKRLRDRKHRPDKPLAIMFPSIDRVREYCQVNALAAQFLQSANAPIVLLPVHDSRFVCVGETSRREASTGAERLRQRSLLTLPDEIAPGNPYLGVMLPYTPLHHLLLAELDFPIIATSGNRSGEPICIDETQALQTLAEIADVFLVHNRPIARPVDDSIGQIINGRDSLLRRARGYAPMPIPLGDAEITTDETILAVGGHLKNTVALYINRQLFVSPYIGDLDSVSTCDRLRSTIQELCSLYNTTPAIVAHDAHPDYYSTQFTQTLATTKAPPPRLISVQHHYAHVLSCLADHQWQLPILGIAWDGTGYGVDGTIWGGEFLWLPAASGFIRAAHLRTFPLPGGEKAVKEPRRCALGLLYECLGEAAFDSTRQTRPDRLDLAPVQSFLPAELSILKTMLQSGLNTPKTSSMGRLFDAIASLLGLCHRSSFAGQAAMQLEYAIDGCTTDAVYPYLIHDQPLQFDYVPMVRAILQDLDDRVSPAIISATFHNTLVAGLVDITCRLRNQYPEMEKVVLTGGCFQNRYLLERSINQLQQQDFLVGDHHQLPSNDGGIAVGQIMAALQLLNHESAAINDRQRS